MVTMDELTLYKNLLSDIKQRILAFCRAYPTSRAKVPQAVALLPNAAPEVERDTTKLLAFSSPSDASGSANEMQP